MQFNILHGLFNRKPADPHVTGPVEVSGVFHLFHPVGGEPRRFIPASFHPPLHKQPGFRQFGNQHAVYSSDANFK